MKIGAMLAALLLLASILSPQAEAQRRAPAQGCPTIVPRSGGGASKLAAADNQFGFRLFAALLSRAGDQNTFISPLSAAAALQMAYDGARGSTQTAMAHALNLKGMSQAAVRQQAATLLSTLAGADPHVQLDVANSLWARSGQRFQPQFMRHVRTAYAARVATLDFNAPSAPKTINGWVRCATHNTITSMVDHIPPDLILYLMNAVYFHGAWTASFDPAQTRSEPFTTADGSQKTVPMMHRSGGFPYYAGTDFQAISIPYGKKRFDLVALLPRPGVPLASLARRLNAATWKGWLSRLRPTEIALGLPRLKLQDQHNLVPALASLGMGIAFTDAADFSGMCVYPCLISQAVQKTYLSVDEKGTTASGVTGIGIVPTAMPPSIELNRPFLLTIRDSRTGAVLFLGAIQNPS